MSEADKMFEELGYEIGDGYGLNIDHKNTIVYKHEFYIDEYEIQWECIVFDLRAKTVDKITWDDCNDSFSAEEIKAIYKKILELGW